MTDLQKAFAEQYVIDYHITDAGKRAGIQGDNINITAWKMLQLPEVQTYVEQLQAEAAKRASVTKDELIAEFRKIGFSNIKNYMHDDLSAKDLSEVKNPEAIKSIKKTVTESEFGSKVQVEFTLHDKVAGLVNLGRHIGFFSEDNSQKNSIIQLMALDPLNTTSPDEDKSVDN
jgi:phage terminase small subunit